MNSKKIAIFDLDGTFVNANSTYDFIKFVFKQKKRIDLLFYFFVLELCQNSGILQFLRIDIRKKFINKLKGFNKEDIQKLAEKFVDLHLLKCINQDILNKFNELKEREFLTILLSSTIDVVGNVFAKKMNFDGDCESILAFNDNNVCLGYLEKDLLGKKEIILNEIEETFGVIDFKNSYCFSDNFEDIKLLKKIGNSFGVINNRESKKRWFELGIQTIYVAPTFSGNIKKLYLPFFYYKYSRLNYFSSFFYFFFEYLLLPLLILFLVQREISLKNILLFIIAFLGYISIYEIGYLINDCVSVKNEKDPNLRADSRIKSELKNLILSRIIFFIIVSFLLFKFINIKNVIIYVLGILIVFFIFAVHNFSKKFAVRYITFPLLRFSHFIIPLLIFNMNFSIVFLVYFLYIFLKDEISYLNRDNQRYINKIFLFNFIYVIILTTSFFYLSKINLNECCFILNNNINILKNVGIYLIFVDLPIVFKKLFNKLSIKNHKI